MSSYYATTVSNEVKVTDVNAVQKIISKYKFGICDDELNVELDNDGMLSIYGADEIRAYRLDDPSDYLDHFDVFLEELAPYLSEPLVVQEVGTEKCIFAKAYAFVIKPKGRVRCVSLECEIDKVLKSKRR